MAWDVRPTTDLEEFKRRRRRDRALLRRLARGRRARAAVRERPAAGADARRVRRRPDRRWRGGVSVRADRARRHRPLRRRDRRRRPADAPSSRRADGDDARPARGHPRARRADRGALGLGGGHLPPVRLRHGVALAARCRCRAATPACASRPTLGRRARLVPLDDVEGRARADLRPRPPPHARHVRAAPTRGGRLRNLPDPPDRRQGGGEKNALVLELDGEPAGYALYRVHSKFENGAAAGHVDVIEAIADGPVATRELWRVLLDMDWKATLKAYLLPIDHPLVHQLSYPRRMQHADRRRALGAARRRRCGALGARLRRRRPGRVRGRGLVPARERRPLAARRRQGRADRGRRPTSRSTSASSARRIWAASRSASSSARASSAS